MTVSANNPLTEMVYTSLAGTNVYAFKDITSISAFRGVAAEKEKRFASLNLTRDELSKLLDKAISAVNEKQDFVTAISILQEMRWRNAMICEENTLLGLASIYLMIDGEDAERPTDEFNRRKMELCKAETDLRAFFLREALALAGSFSAKQGADLLTYLEETKHLAETRMKRFTQ